MESFCFLCARSGGAGGVNAIGIKDVSHGYDSFEFVDIGAVDDGEDVDVGFAHAFEGEMQGVIGVDMGEIKGLEESDQDLFVASVGKGAA